MGESLDTKEKPKAQRPPMICWSPFIMYHQMMVDDCSSFLYLQPRVRGFNVYSRVDVPKSRENHKSGLTRRFKGTEETTEDDEGREALGHGVKRERDAPEDNVDGQPLGDGNALDDPVFLGQKLEL